MTAPTSRQPYACPAFRCRLKNHDECWREFNRQEDAAEYDRDEDTY